LRQPLTERYRERLAGVLSCYDRMIVTDTLPGACYAKGMTGFLSARQIRIFDYPRFAEPLRDRVRERAAELASAAGITQRGCIEIVFGSTPEWRDRIDVTQPLRQTIGSFGGREIGLGQNQPIGHRDLFDAFGLRVELPRAVHSVDRRYHVTEAEMVPQHRI
jgi:hypothetical protein